MHAFKVMYWKWSGYYLFLRFQAQILPGKYELPMSLQPVFLLIFVIKTNLSEVFRLIVNLKWLSGFLSSPRGYMRITQVTILPGVENKVKPWQRFLHNSFPVLTLVKKDNRNIHKSVYQQTVISGLLAVYRDQFLASVVGVNSFFKSCLIVCRGNNCIHVFFVWLFLFVRFWVLILRKAGLL